MRKLIIAALIVIVPYTMQAQLGGFINKAKAKVKQRIDEKADKALDNTLDEIEGKKTPAPVKEQAVAKAEKPAEKGESAEKAHITSYSKFDFIPGEKILYTEDFGQDAIGELPVNWNSSGKGEVRTMDNKPGKWLRIFQGNTYLTGNKKAFGENYTVEFDMIYFFQPKNSGYLLPSPAFGLFSSGEQDNTDNSFLRDQNSINATEITVYPYGNGAARLESHKKRAQTFNSDRAPLNNYQESFNKVLHYSIQVQKQRFRLWVNETKIFDIPRAVNVPDTMNQMYFRLEGSNYKDEEIGLFISNLKVATGVPDTRHKLIDEGKLSTTGILFDFQSAVIKQESYGVVKEIAGVLKENASVNIKVVGYTSNDGDDAANMELSKQRAASVKDLMVKEYGIDEARIKTEGKGETQPVADNKTKEGKAQNRRVEFIKL